MTLDVQSLGAAVVDCSFCLPTNETVHPFFVNPWRNDGEEELSGLPPMLRHLSGEWPCVPFGTPSVRQGLPWDWQLEQSPADWNSDAHGFGSHHDWVLNKVDGSNLQAEISYPSNCPVHRLGRTISLDPDNLRVNFSLQIEAREPVRMPIGVHPVFDLSHSAPNSCRLRVKGEGSVWTFPMDTEPGHSHFLPDQRGVNIGRLRSVGGDTFDATRVPFPTLCEDILMLTHPNGCVTLEMPDKGYAVSVEWDPSAFPSCVLWYSNGGRQEYPWNGRVRAIGIEPVAAPFDLGLQQCLSHKNPLKGANVQSSIFIEANAMWETKYSISLTQL